MITLTALHHFLNELLIYDKKLDLSKIDPHMANGLQVKGQEAIKKIGLAVSASMEVFKLAVKHECQALVVHHCVSLPPSHKYHQIFQDRLAYLIRHDMNLFGYHYLLDSHPDIGHNAKIIKILQGEITASYTPYGNIAPWGYYAKLQNTKLDQIIEKLKPFSSPVTTLYPFGPKKIKTVAVCSGQAAPYPSDLQNLINHKVDLYITGAVTEWSRELFREAKINFLSAGHYHTEKFGLLALKKILKDKLAVETEFLEFENEV